MWPCAGLCNRKTNSKALHRSAVRTNLKEVLPMNCWKLEYVKVAFWPFIFDNIYKYVAFLISIVKYWPYLVIVIGSSHDL